MTRWWLISDEDIAKGRETLESAIREREELCSRDGCLCDLDGRECAQYYRDALHHLESGMHVTDAIPSDFAIADA